MASNKNATLVPPVRTKMPDTIMDDVDLLSDEQGDVEQFEQQMEQWLADNDCQNLRDAQQLGYEISGAYIRQRAESDFPGFTHDPNNSLVYLKKRINPSEQAVKLALQTKERIDQLPEGIISAAGIAWAEPMQANDSDQQKEQLRRDLLGEVIFCHNYLGRATLILPVNVDLAVERVLRKLIVLQKSALSAADKLRLIAEEEHNMRVKAALVSEAQGELPQLLRESGLFSDTVLALIDDQGTCDLALEYLLTS